MMMFQQSPNRHQQAIHSMQILLLLLLAATLLWVLSAMNMVQGVWASVLNAAFTGLSTTFAFLQWHVQATPERPTTTTLPLSDKAVSHEQFIQSPANKRKGAIVVYTSRKWRGTTLHLVPGLQGTAWPIEAAANVVERRVAGQRLFLCHFPAIPPGHYSLVTPSRQRWGQITVCPGHLSEIDWR